MTSFLFSRVETNPHLRPEYYLQTPFNNQVRTNNLDEEELKVNIHRILDPVPDETVDGVVEAIKYAGLESMSDLRFVQEDDLILVLKPIQRRKLINAWRKLKSENVPSEEPVLLPTEMPSTVCPSQTTAKKNFKWKKGKRCLVLLQVYAKYKMELLCPGVEEDRVWRKISDELNLRCSINSNPLQCCKKIGELKFNYERSKNQVITTLKKSLFMADAKYAFEETTKDSGGCTINIKKENEVSSTSATSASGPGADMMEDPVLGPFTAFLGNLPHDITKDDIVMFFKHIKVKNIHLENCDKDKQKDVCFVEFYNLQDLRQALKFNNKTLRHKNIRVELPEDLGAANNHLKDLVFPMPIIVCPSQYTATKNFDWNKDQRSLVLLQIYTKHKMEVLRPGADRNKVWKKISDELNQTCLINSDASQCRYKIEKLKFDYEINKNKVITNLKEAVFMIDVKYAFEDISGNSVAGGHGVDMMEDPTLGPFTAFLANLPRAITENDIVMFFQHLEVKNIYLENCDSTRPKVVCFAEFYNLQDLRQALAFNNKVFKNKIIRVEIQEETDSFPAGLLKNIPVRYRKNIIDFRHKLLQVYAKYKREFACPNIEEQKVWGKICKEMKKNSYYCNESLYRLELSQLKCQYENLKNSDVKGENMFYFSAAREAFETSNDPAASNPQVGGMNRVLKNIPPPLRNGENGPRKRVKTSDKVYTIKISNFSKDVTESDLHEMFCPYGKIHRIYLSTNPSTQSESMAFVSFYEKDEAAKAILALNGFKGLKIEFLKSADEDFE